MSEYMERHTVARLIGAPPGYVGHDEGGQLTEAVRRRPYSVVLFDEIEKAHGDIQNLLLQILEDGCLTDSQGRKADFSNTIILLTSNLGARCLSGQTAPLGFGAADSEAERRGKQALQEAKAFFRPELMGRLDETVLFDPLGPQQLAAIADRLLTELEERAAQQGYTLNHTPAAARCLAAGQSAALRGAGTAPHGEPGGGAGAGRSDCGRHGPLRVRCIPPMPGRTGPSCCRRPIWPPAYKEKTERPPAIQPGGLILMENHRVLWGICQPLWSVCSHSSESSLPGASSASR